MSRIKTLVLHARRNGVTSYHDDWKDAFTASEICDTTCVDVRDRRSTGRLAGEIGVYELIVLLHSATADTIFIEPYRAILNSRKGKLLVFVANELNYPQHGSGMRHKLAFLREVGANFIATQMPLEAGRIVYEDLASAVVIQAPHALNPVRFSPLTPNSERQIDIGVRSFNYFPFLGDNERNSIMDYFANTSFVPPLVVDVETDADKRFTADAWPRFLNTCKGTIATEAGSYYLEKDDATVLRVADYIKKKHGGAAGRSIGLYESRFKKLIPRRLKGPVLKLLKMLRLESLSPYNVYHSIDFDEVYNLFFKDYENPLSCKSISSRHFDAIGTKTCQIMFPGRFNDILTADEHYISLNRDFSNIDEVLEKFRDGAFRNRMVDDTYDYVIANHTHQHRIRDIAHAVMATA